MTSPRPQGWLNARNKDYYGGVLMFLLGAGTIWKGYEYKIGSLSQMGPGYFPVGVGAVLALMGVLIALRAHNGSEVDSQTEVFRPEWRGWFAIILGTIAFIVFGRYGGLLPATFAIVFISALGDRQNTFKSALLLSLAMVVVCVVVFWWALQLQFPLFRWG